MIVAKEVVPKIFKVMAELKLNNAKLARMVGLDRTTIGNYGKGKAIPKLSTLKRIFKALNMRPPEIIRGMYSYIDGEIPIIWDDKLIGHIKYQTNPGKFMTYEFLPEDSKITLRSSVALQNTISNQVYNNSLEPINVMQNSYFIWILPNEKIYK